MLLYCSGPFKFSGVPLRRVNQSYMIGTSTKVNISGVNVEKFDDKYFAKESEVGSLHIFASAAYHDLFDPMLIVYS